MNDCIAQGYGAFHLQVTIANEAQVGFIKCYYLSQSNYSLQTIFSTNVALFSIHTWSVNQPLFLRIWYSELPKKEFSGTYLSYELFGSFAHIHPLPTLLSAFWAQLRALAIQFGNCMSSDQLWPFTIYSLFNGQYQMIWWCGADSLSHLSHGLLPFPREQVSLSQTPLAAIVTLVGHLTTQAARTECV